MIASLLRARTLAVLLGFGALGVTAALYITVRHAPEGFGPDPQTVTLLIFAILLLLTALGIIIARRAWRMWRAFRTGSVGARLQTRVVLVFSLVAMIPTLLISVFSVVFFNHGIQAWFDHRVSTALEESVTVARAYLTEHQDTIRADAIATARDLDRESYLLMANPSAFTQILGAQARLRSLTDAVVLQRNRIVAMTGLSFSLAFEQVPPDVIERVQSGEVAILDGQEEGKVLALTRLESVPDGVLIVGRFVDARVLEHMDTATGAVAEYRRLKARLKGIQVEFSAAFLSVALLLLLGTVWYGMLFAGQLVQPVGWLVRATDRVRAGDFSARVEERPGGDEIGTLGRAFNRMAEQLETQRKSLIEANRQLDARRRFSEAVLGGVSAGVVALDRHRIITLSNRSARQLLGVGEIELHGKPCAEALPEFAALVEHAAEHPEGSVQDQLRVTREEQTLSLHARITVEEVEGELHGFVITFDDMTELTRAQRASAWADVARRIAHEIKNPLTPIQLAAERLKRKYGKQVAPEEQDTFAKYTDTISRHVGDIGKMVEEFVSFARMPAPAFAEEDLADLIRRAVFSEQVAHPGVRYAVTLPDTALLQRCDAQQMQQVLGNLLKNAAETLETGTVAEPCIEVSLAEEARGRRIIISDNGPGFPPDQIDRLTEPYVTTRAKGTGLGLAIVKKIIDDHGGTLTLENGPDGGARVTVFFPLDATQNPARS